MRKTTTPKQNEAKGNKAEVVAPSSKSLDFLKAFARSYHADKSLPASLSGYCVN